MSYDLNRGAGVRGIRAPVLLGGSPELLACSPGQNRGALGEAVMRGVWEVTLGEEGARTLQGMLLRPLRAQPALWEVGVLEPGGLGPVGLPSRKGPRAAPKSTSPRSVRRAPSGPYCSRPLKDQRSLSPIS